MTFFLFGGLSSRFLAHAKVESLKSKEAAEQRMLKKRSWFSFRWFVINYPLICLKQFYILSFIFLKFLICCSYLSYLCHILDFCPVFPCYLRSTATADVSAGDTSEEANTLEDQLTREEWQAINKLLSYQPDEELVLQYGKENMIQYLLDVSISRAAARIIDIDHTEIVCGRFENLCVSTKLKHRNSHCDVTLKFYGLSAPEGSLAQVCAYFECHLSEWS